MGELVRHRAPQYLKLVDQPIDLPVNRLLALIEQAGEDIDLAPDGLMEVGAVSIFGHRVSDAVQGHSGGDDLAGDFGRREHGVEREAGGRASQ